MNYPKNANFFMFILMIFFIFIGNSVSAIIFKIYPNLLSKDNVWVFQVFFSIFCFIVPIILYMVVKRLKFKDILPLKPLSIKNFFILIFMAFTMQPMLQLIAFITNIFHKDELSEALNIFAGLSLPKALFTVAIVPAITEELAFRGVILTGYKKTNIFIAILMSSIYFGMIHFTVTQLFYTIVAGIIFASVVKVTQSIYAGMLIHFVFNGTQITMAHFLIKYINNLQSKVSNGNNILQQIESQLSNPNYGILQFVSVVVKFIFSIPFLILSVFLFVRFNKKEIDTLIEENKQLKNSQDTPNIFTVFFYINILAYLAFMIFKKIYG